MGTPLCTSNHCTLFLVNTFKRKMKCFVVFFTIVASAMAEPWLGLGAGLAGAPLLGAGLGYAAGPGFPASNLVSTASIRTVPAAPTTSQFRREDEFRNFEFGYDNPNSARSEAGNAYGGVTGSYINKATGATINYIADGLGYRVTGVANRRKKRSPQIITQSIPATRPATRINIQYNPGFATGYIVL